MILKVKIHEDSWSYFECDIIHSKYELLKNVSAPGDDSILFEVCPTNTATDNQKVRVLNLETIERHLRTIVTDKVCYVLNNQGKTIDKI